MTSKLFHNTYKMKFKVCWLPYKIQKYQWTLQYTEMASVYSSPRRFLPPIADGNKTLSWRFFSDQKTSIFLRAGKSHIPTEQEHFYIP